MNVKDISCIDVATKLNIKKSGTGTNYHCFNGQAHKNNDIHPSLSISDKGFNCFACDVKRNNVGLDKRNNVELVKRVMNIDTSEAYKWLKNEFNISSSITYTKENTTKVSKYDIEIYNKLFAFAGGIDTKHNEYLKSRGFGSLILEYGITNVKDDTEKLLKSIFSMEQLLHSGVFSLSKNDKPYFTFFNNTLLFPFRFEDNIVYIQGRTIADSKLKYRNLKKEISYPYNVDILLHSDIGSEEVLICEGVIDTQTMLEKGYNAIGILGAKNFKKEWVELFDKYEVIPVIALDNDDAGNIGAENIVNIFKKNIKRLIPTNGKDWNEEFRNEIQR